MKELPWGLSYLLQTEWCPSTAALITARSYPCKLMILSSDEATQVNTDGQRHLLDRGLFPDLFLTEAVSLLEIHFTLLTQKP